ncbi:hypothetical protein L3V16_22835 [Brucella ciceri]|uniref:hypothetical protein n=1 Tax=Brucella ciceri TaxID=391287 RepID=UPI001F12B4CA|nr:hypothetical protein [Brucella ciceri]MCH6206660.1 hypothetical protein [Brucella ciceri]
MNYVTLTETTEKRLPVIHPAVARNHVLEIVSYFDEYGDEIEPDEIIEVEFGSILKSKFPHMRYANLFGYDEETRTGILELQFRSTTQFVMINAEDGEVVTVPRTPIRAEILKCEIDPAACVKLGLAYNLGSKA